MSLTPISPNQSPATAAMAEIQAIELTADTIRKFLCPKASDQDIALTMELCRVNGLNPFTKEVYIIKYGDAPAQIIVSKDVFSKRARSSPNYQGFDAGVIVEIAGKIERTKGVVPPSATLIGAWCIVHIDGKRPVEVEVNLAEYNTNQSNWKSKTATMIRKVAYVHAHREAFPDCLQGLYVEEEMGTNKTSMRMAEIPVVTGIQDNPEILAQYKDTVEAINDSNLLTDCMDEAKRALSGDDYQALRTAAIARNKALKDLLKAEPSPIIDQAPETES